MSRRKAASGLTQAEVRQLCAGARENAPATPAAPAPETPRRAEARKLSRALCVGCDPVTRQTLRAVAPISSIIFDHSDDIAATIYSKLGIPLDLSAESPDSRPVRLIEGRVIKEWV